MLWCFIGVRNLKDHPPLTTQQAVSILKRGSQLLLINQCKVPLPPNASLVKEFSQMFLLLSLGSSFLQKVPAVHLVCRIFCEFSFPAIERSLFPLLICLKLSCWLLILQVSNLSQKLMFPLTSSIFIVYFLINIF